MSETQRRKRLNDASEIILETALDVIATHGVAGTTHRKVAHYAGLSLGSVTHRFGTIETLLLEAFRHLRSSVDKHFADSLLQAQNLAEAREAVVDLICSGSWTTSRNMALSYELYALGARNPQFKAIQSEWMAMSRAHLERHFSPPIARALDAFIEGATIQNASAKVPMTRREVRDVVARLTARPRNSHRSQPASASDREL